MSKKDRAESKPFVYDDSEMFRRPTFRHVMAIFGALVLLLLNFSFVMTIVERSARHGYFDWRQEALMFLVILLMDILILVPVLFEVNWLKVSGDKIVLRTIFWRATVNWADIVEFKQPNYTSHVLLRTKRCFYLINKRDFKRYEELAKIISSRVSKQIA